MKMEVISPNEMGKPMSDSGIIEQFDNLVASKYSSLAEFMGDGTVLFIVNDVARSTPTAKILALVDKYLGKTGKDLRSRDASVILATGSHGAPPEDGLRKILGDYFEHFKQRLMIHNARECEAEHIGDSKVRTPVKIDRKVLGFDRIIAINSVEPHYFAGYTGGRKSLIPGICHFDTIQANHGFALSENSRTLSLEGNPVHEDMMDIAGIIVGYLAKKGTEVMAINCVETQGAIHGFSAGDIFECWRALIPKCNELFTVKVEGKFDIIIAEAIYPHNRIMYQALKCFENAKLVLREGGIIILDAKCDGGIGPDNFYKLMTSAPTPEEIIEKVRRNYTLDAQKTTNLLEFLENNKMYIASELPDDVVENVYCRPFDDVEKALEKAIKEVGIDNPRVLRMTDAYNVVPLES
jgi:nickel-dependent lactate racemase